LKSYAYKALALVGAGVFSFASFVVLINWSDFGGHSCYSYSGCPATALDFVFSYVVYAAPCVLMSFLSLVMVLVGLVGLTGSMRRKYAVMSVLVGIIVILGLFSYILLIASSNSVPPPTGTSTTTSSTTAG